MSVAKFVYADYFVTVLAETKEKKKIVALLSGGLDSTLAIKTMQKQGFEVSAVAIKTPFCDFDCGRGCGFEIREKADNLGVNLKTVYLGDEYIEMLKHPKHGFGSGMNPCIDCRAMMFEAGKKHMEEIGAEFIISGEVLGQRPMRSREEWFDKKKRSWYDTWPFKKRAVEDGKRIWNRGSAQCWRRMSINRSCVLVKSY